MAKFNMLSFILWSMILFSCTGPANDSRVLPGEWEPQEAIWFGWEHRQEVIGYHEAIFEIIRHLKDRVQIKIVSPTDSVGENAKQLLAAKGIAPDKLTFYTIADNRYWIRDHGPTYVRNKTGQLEAVDFGWNRHSNGVHLVDKIAAEMEGLHVVSADLVNEGGAIESNGAGTIMLVEAVTLGRNPGKSKAEIEAIYWEVVGAKKVIWLPEGLANAPDGLQHIAEGYYGYGTGGHIDEFARFVDPHTILLAWVDEKEKEFHPINRLNFDVLQRVYKILEKSTDQDGNPFTIIKLPLPDPISKKMRITSGAYGLTNSTLDTSYFQGDIIPNPGDTIDFVAAASYNNFLITNGAVVLPTYLRVGSSAQKEGRVREIFSSVFPDRELVFIDCMYQNYRGGGIHCSTKQQPKY